MQTDAHIVLPQNFSARKTWYVAHFWKKFLFYNFSLIYSFYSSSCTFWHNVVKCCHFLWQFSKDFHTFFHSSHFPVKMLKLKNISKNKNVRIFLFCRNFFPVLKLYRALNFYLFFIHNCVCVLGESTTPHPSFSSQSHLVCKFRH
jgi:hypothetical protein